MAEEEKVGAEGESGQAGGGLSAADAEAIRCEAAERAGDELTRAARHAAVAVANAPTTRQRIAAWLGTIGTADGNPPVHPSRRADAAALIESHSPKLIAAIESGDDAALKRVWDDLAHALRYGGFSIAADRTPAALERKEQRLRDIQFALQREGYRADEIAAAMTWAGNDPDNFGRVNWEFIEIRGERIDRRRIQLATRPRWSKVSDEKWLSAFPKIAPPPGPPEPDWDKKLIVQE